LQVVNRNTNIKIQLAVERSRHREKPGPTNLTPMHLSGAFILLGAGLSMSLIIFLLENYFHYRKMKKNRDVVMPFIH
jgi:hypothetical protein